ncbi:MAG: hypothetical protein GY731_10960 [Gammaproteobacteria bacterium]|nr:hypothetical protein [Gammaproteobacteria bacterium]
MIRYTVQSLCALTLVFSSVYAHAYPIDATPPSDSNSSILFNWTIDGSLGIIDLLYPVNGSQTLTFDTTGSGSESAVLAVRLFNDTGTTWVLDNDSVGVSGGTISSIFVPMFDIEDADGIAGTFVGDLSSEANIGNNLTDLKTIGAAPVDVTLNLDTFGSGSLALTFTVVPIPLPASIFLMGPVLLSLATFRRRRVHY